MTLIDANVILRFLIGDNEDMLTDILLKLRLLVKLI